MERERPESMERERPESMERERPESMERERPESMERERPEEMESDFTVMRCSPCGDTFPIEGNMALRCRTCGSQDIAPALEPLL